MSGQIDARALKDFWVDEAPSGTVNGSNTSFTLSQAPHETDCINLTLDGIKIYNGTHFTVSGATITMTTAPAVGQDLRANYVRKSGE